MSFRKPRHRDANEPDIVKALRAVGASVIEAEPPCPDLVVGFKGATYLLGVKAPDGPRGGTSHGRGRKNRVCDHRPDSWQGGPWFIVTGPAEALGVLGLPTVVRESLNDIGRRIDARLRARLPSQPGSTPPNAEDAPAPRPGEKPSGAREPTP